MTNKFKAREAIARTIQIVLDNPKLVAMWCTLGLVTELAILPYGGFATTRDFLLFFPAILISTAIYYYIAQRMLSATGHPADKSNVLAYLGASILYGLIIGIGFIFLIIPGFILWARLSLFVPILLAEGKSVADLGSESWARTSGNTSEILLAYLPPFAMLVPLWLISIVNPSLGASFDIFTAIFASLAGAYWFALTIALYERFPAAADTAAA
ncbi:hypothetical protein [Erythrobacter aureus]|uniref:Uncharacterized protein n=1 Tax=Erythrobacter aureus TaxID=2182384 RepID=A0A345YIF8_9SPHN|nr:hypothetical protein [Erythrobacter aureus]AXK43710.1 hypothetical protein DVR09_14720 [Erythrobacter aureus]